jgi:hypothetical protein
VWWRRLHAHIFRGQLLELAAHPVANFAVQALVSSAPNAPLFGQLLKELLPELGTILPTRPTLALKIAQWSAWHGSGCKDVVRGLRQAFTSEGSGSDDSDGGGAFALAVLAIGSQSGSEAARGSAAAGGSAGSGNRHLNVHSIGSRVVQALATYPQGAADALVASMASVGRKQLVELAQHPQGSRALEAVLKGPSGTAAKLKISSPVCEAAVRLARDRSGCHVLEAAFHAAAIDERSKVRALGSVGARLSHALELSSAAEPCHDIARLTACRSGRRFSSVSQASRPIYVRARTGVCFFASCVSTTGVTTLSLGRKGSSVRPTWRNRSPTSLLMSPS